MWRVVPALWSGLRFGYMTSLATDLFILYIRTILFYSLRSLYKTVLFSTSLSLVRDIILNSFEFIVVRLLNCLFLKSSHQLNCAVIRLHCYPSEPPFRAASRDSGSTGRSAFLGQGMSSIWYQYYDARRSVWRTMTESLL